MKICACKKSLLRFRNKKFRGLSWFLCSKQHIIVRWYTFEIFQNICLKIYEPDPALFLSAPGLERQAALKKTKVKLDLLADIDMLLMIEKGIRGGICHAIYQYVKRNNKYMKSYDKW